MDRSCPKCPHRLHLDVIFPVKKNSSRILVKTFNIFSSAGRKTSRVCGWSWGNASCKGSHAPILTQTATPWLSKLKETRKTSSCETLTAAIRNGNSNNLFPDRLSLNDLISLEERCLREGRVFAFEGESLVR